MSRIEHALVIGGGMAGLVAARVLGAQCKRVTVVERDTYPQGAEARKGVPQGRHVHLLLTRGKNLLERLFPGLEDELAQAGAPEVDWNADCAWRNTAGWGPRFPSRAVTRACSRDLLESTVRSRLKASGRVEFIEEREVVGLLACDDNRRVAGVRVRRRGGAKLPEEDLYANLVVDASGRSSRGPEWLVALGYEPPRETVVNALARYATRWYEQPPGHERDWKALIISAEPPVHARGGVIFPVEGGRWVVTLAGIADDTPRTDEEGYLDYARRLISPRLYEAIKDARPLSPIYGYARMENRLRHYEELKRRPVGFVLLGDAVCAFNPVYGQGMTTAALGALALGRTLREHTRRTPGGDLTGFTQSFQRRLAKLNSTPWLMATGEDFRWPTTEGGHPGAMVRLTHRYMDQVLVLAYQHPSVKEAFLEVLHMLKPPTALFHPAIALRVLLLAARGGGMKAAHRD